MAKLDELAKSLNVQLPSNPNIENTNEKSTAGSKRRPWLEDINKSPDEIGSKGVYRPLTQKGLIKGVDQPILSTPFINPVDQPLLKNEVAKGVYRPLLIDLKDLRGNPLRITQYFFELSKKETEHITNKVTQTDVMNSLNISKDSAKTGLRFLLKNELIKRVEFKIGKAGWSKYKLKEELFIELDQSYEKGSINPFCNTEAQKGSNGSYYINNNTTTRPLLDWDNIDIEPLMNIGFTKKHLLQMKSKNSPDVVQESIYHFSHALQFNTKTQKYNDPLSVLIGVLRKGEAWIELNYKSPHELALERIVEEKKKQHERILALEDELIKSEFEEWFLNLPETQKNELTKELNYGSFSELVQEKIKKGHLFQYFKLNIKNRLKE